MKPSLGHLPDNARDAIYWATLNRRFAAGGLMLLGTIVLAAECAGVMALASMSQTLGAKERLMIVAAIVAVGVAVTAIAKAVQAGYGQVADTAWEATWWVPGDHDLLIMLGVIIATGGVWMIWNACANLLRVGYVSAAEHVHATSVLARLLAAAEAQPVTHLPPAPAATSNARAIRLLLELGLVDVSHKRDRIWATTDAYKHARTVRERAAAKPFRIPT